MALQFSDTNWFLKLEEVLHVYEIYNIALSKPNWKTANSCYLTSFFPGFTSVVCASFFLTFNYVVCASAMEE